MDGAGCHLDSVRVAAHNADKTNTHTYLGGMGSISKTHASAEHTTTPTSQHHQPNTGHKPLEIRCEVRS